MEEVVKWLKDNEKCSMCGYCCVVEICPIYKRVFGEAEPPCPALKGNKCELVGKGLDELLGIGEGCGSKRGWRKITEMGGFK